MNYCIVAFAIVLIISVIQWFVDGRKNYKGPHIDESAMKNTALDGVSLGAQVSGDGSSVAGPRTDKVTSKEV